MRKNRLEYAWRTDKGLIRSHNEDAVAVFPDLGLVVIADGIGGASAGEVASRLATNVIGDRFRNRPDLPESCSEAVNLAEEAVEEANAAIWSSAQSSEHYAGMGTTVVVGFLRNDWLVFAHVGDSRLYRMREGDLIQLTRDHSLIQEVVDQGFFPTLEDAMRYGINTNILTRGLGTTNPVTVDSGEVDLRRGDLFLFCTDGLTGMVSNEALHKALNSAGADLEALAQELVDLALDGGGLDNITVALARVD